VYHKGTHTARETITRTIRLTPEVDRELQQLAKQERVSVNYLVTSSLKKLTEWDIAAEKFGFVSIPGFLHAKMYSYFTPEQAKELGEWAAKNFGRDFILFRFKKLSLDTVLETLRLFGSRARIFSLQHTFDGKTHTIIVKHGLGAKGSVFNEEFLTSLFKVLLNVDPESERTEDQVVIRLRIPRETHKPSWSESRRQPSERRILPEIPLSYRGSSPSRHG
jgi:hypothetical protein